jgi:hypothetical protein
VKFEVTPLSLCRLITKTQRISLLPQLRDPVRSCVLIFVRTNNKEVIQMRAMPDEEMERTAIDSRKQELEQRLAVIEAKARMLAQQHGRLAAGIALGAVAAFGIGMMVFRRRQKKSMVRRMRSSIPDAAWDLPEELIAQLKKPLQRVAKAR